LGNSDVDNCLSITTIYCLCFCIERNLSHFSPFQGIPISTFQQSVNQTESKKLENGEGGGVVECWHWCGFAHLQSMTKIFKDKNEVGEIRQ
jgi:hypothetical protein